MVYAVKGVKMNELWNLDLGATTHCMGNEPSFDTLNPYNGTLGTASTSTPIIGQGTVRAHLLDNSLDSIVKLGGVKLIPGM